MGPRQAISSATCAILKPWKFKNGSLHRHCTVTAPSLHRHCTVTAPSLHHRCASTAPALHHHRTITAPSLHHHCTITAQEEYDAYLADDTIKHNVFQENGATLVIHNAAFHAILKVLCFGKRSSVGRSEDDRDRLEKIRVIDD